MYQDKKKITNVIKPKYLRRTTKGLGTLCPQVTYYGPFSEDDRYSKGQIYQCYSKLFLGKIKRSLNVFNTYRKSQ